MRPLTRRLTLRSRLTLIYGGLFFLAGVVLLGLTYLLLRQNLFRNQLVGIRTTGPARDAPGADPGGSPPVPTETLTDYLVEHTAGLRNDALASLLSQGAIALLVVGAAAAVLGWLVAGRLLAPLGRITDTARRIAAAPAAGSGLHERIALRGPRDELRDLADTFDSMLARLDHAFDGQRRFVANASHELRTPLTLTRSLVEVAMRRRTASEDVQRLGEVLLEVNARQERLINGLLMLARSENELATRSPVDLSDVVTHVTGWVAEEAAGAGVEVSVQAAAAVVAGDPVLLERLVQNLVENAVRHNAPDGWVRVSTGADAAGAARLEVSNTGPAVPAYDLPALFEPFHRLRSEAPRGAGASPGAGLGLSIVRAITRAHGGKVTAASRPEGGLTVTVSFPAPAAGQEEAPSR